MYINMNIKNRIRGLFWSKGAWRACYASRVPSPWTRTPSDLDPSRLAPKTHFKLYIDSSSIWDANALPSSPKIDSQKDSEFHNTALYKRKTPEMENDIVHDFIVVNLTVVAWWKTCVCVYVCVCHRRLKLAEFVYCPLTLQTLRTIHKSITVSSKSESWTLHKRPQMDHKVESKAWSRRSPPHWHRVKMDTVSPER